MAQSVRAIELSMVSNSALDTTTSEYRVCRVAGSNTVDVVNTVTNFPFGILQNKPKAGAAALVRIGGSSKAVCAASVGVGEQVTFNTSGAIMTDAGATVTALRGIVGIALENGSTNSVIEVALFPQMDSRTS